MLHRFVNLCKLLYVEQRVGRCGKWVDFMELILRGEVIDEAPLKIEVGDVVKIIVKDENGNSVILKGEIEAVID